MLPAAKRELWSGQWDVDQEWSFHSLTPRILQNFAGIRAVAEKRFVVERDPLTLIAGAVGVQPKVFYGAIRGWFWKIADSKKKVFFFGEWKRLQGAKYTLFEDCFHLLGHLLRS